MELNTQAIVGLLMALGTLASTGGAAYAWWVGRDLRKATSQLRQAEADAGEIGNYATLSRRIGELEQERASDYQEITTLRNEQAETQADLRQLRSEHTVLQLTLSRYERGVKILIAQLRRLDIEPEWTPEDDELL